MTLRELKETGIKIAKKTEYYYHDNDLDIIFQMDEEEALDREIISINCCKDWLQIEFAL